MTRYLTFEQIVAINADQGGTLNDANGLRACVHRPQSGAFGVEVFPDVWSKAAAYLHSIATTQYFSDGNKRTAWYAAVTFLRLNGFPLPDIETIEAEVFVQAVAQDVFANDEDPDLTVAKATEWFQIKWETQRVGACLDRRMEWAFLARFGEQLPGALLNLGHALMAGLAEESFPCRVGFFVVARVHWDKADHEHRHQIVVRVEPPIGGAPVVNGEVTTHIEAFHAPPSGHSAHSLTGLVPTDLFIEEWPLIASPGRYTIVLEIDGKLAAKLPLDIRSRQDLTVDDEALQQMAGG